MGTQKPSKAEETSAARQELFSTIDALEKSIPQDVPNDLRKITATLRPLALKAFKTTYEMGVDDGKKVSTDHE